jgi:serine/threonine protein kinase
MHLLGKGAFGCVIENFKFNCGGKYDYPTVQKIVGVGKNENINYRSIDRLEREEKIYEIILKKIPNWKEYYSLAVSYCKLSKNDDIITRKNIFKNTQISPSIKKCIKTISNRKSKEYNQYYVQILPKINGEEFYLLNDEKKELTATFFLEIMKHLIIGLNKLHKNGILHYDIKQENIMWTGAKNFKKDFELVFIDFGLSRILENMDDSKLRGLSYSTPLFESPEVFLLYTGFSSLLLKSNNQRGAISGLQLIDADFKLEAETAFSSFFTLSELDLMFSTKNIKHIKNLIDNGNRHQLEQLSKLKDIYALGIAFSEIAETAKLTEDDKIKKIIRHMISFNYIDKNIPHRLLAHELLNMF